MEWGAHIHHSWDVCVTSNCSFGPKHYFWSAFILDNVVFFRPSCFSTKHRLQEFGIGRSPTHRVVFRSFPFLLCKLSKQTNKHFTFLPSCFHVALYSTLVAHRLIFVRFLCSKFSPIPRICSQLDRLEIALNRFSLSRLAIWNALSQKIFVRRVQCKLSMTYCKSFPNLQFSRKKGGWNRKVCTKGRILDNSSCWWVDGWKSPPWVMDGWACAPVIDNLLCCWVGGWPSATHIAIFAIVLVGEGWVLPTGWTSTLTLTSLSYQLYGFCLLSAWTCPSIIDYMEKCL